MADAGTNAALRANAVAVLDAAPEFVNPALAFYLRLVRDPREMALDEYLRQEAALARAMVVGAAEAKATRTLVGLLADLPAVPGPGVPLGF